MKRLALIVALVSCQRASFSGETFYCDDTAQCAAGWVCARNTCVTDAGVEEVDAGQCSAFDGGRGDCVSDVFCGTTRACEATCTATVYDDFDGPAVTLDIVNRNDGGDVSRRVPDAGRWLLAVTQPAAGQAFLPAGNANRAQLGTCGFSFEVAEPLPTAAGEGWQMMMRFQDARPTGNTTSLGFSIAQGNMALFLDVDGGQVFARARPLSTYYRFAMRPTATELVYWAQRRGLAWEELFRAPIPDGGLPALNPTFWVACFGGLGACTPGERRQAVLESYNVAWPPLP